MAQVKIYGSRGIWQDRRREVSDLVHAALIKTWQLPTEKRFHRFLLLDDGDLIAPRSADYLMIEIICFDGRSDEAKKKLIMELYGAVAPALGLAEDDLEVVIIESPKQNWGIRGVVADELKLSYRVEV
ncbi:tautomerase family protein [Microlunatus elymi]|uniref:Tautomerase family protein n=1 Tax=Microlunatus elymi TaxID=2596828 RepID=A0A516PWR4_9ACTN|nr:tautomerase family protein [Microlunatus elymi]QDP95628.1 tautomerase family protein [Microlunatus elymi]